MKKYRIAIEETLRKVVEIEAETPGLAVCRAEDEYNEEKHVLSADNFAGADIALSTDDSTVMETLEDVDFIGYVQRRFEECRESISVEDKVRLAFGSFDNALYEFGEYRKEAARNRPQVYLLYRSDAWHKRAKRLIAAEGHGLVLPALVIPEVDHLLRHRIGVAACRVFYAGLTNG